MTLYKAAVLLDHNITFADWFASLTSDLICDSNTFDDCIDNNSTTSYILSVISQIKEQNIIKLKMKLLIT